MKNLNQLKADIGIETTMDTNNETGQFPNSTIPADLNIQLSVRADKELVELLGNTLLAVLKELGKRIDISNLAGVTVSSDYNNALANLDRGREGLQTLQPSNDLAVGIAMTPTVLRENQVKSHIVFNADYLSLIISENEDDIMFGLHLLAHECAHVEVTAAYDSCFPNHILQVSLPDLCHSQRDGVSFSCWDEYAATNISAHFGRKPTEDYTTTFLHALDAVHPWVIERIQEYRVHGDLERIIVEVYSGVGNIMKFSSYLAGDLAARGQKITDFDDCVTKLDGHWFAPYLAKLETLLLQISKNFGEWENQEEFEKIGYLADEILSSEFGVHVSFVSENEGSYVDIPYADKTMP